MDEPVHWRVDASTSRTVRVLWALGAGTLLAAVVLLAFSRLVALTVAAERAVAAVAVVAVLCAIAVTILALAAAGDPAARIAALRRRLPGVSAADPDDDDEAPGPDPRRVLDAAVAGVAVGAFMVGAVFGVGGPVGDGLAAATLPLALGAILLAAFLRTAGTLDPEERTLHLSDPPEEVDLDVIVDVSTRRFGDGTLITLEYATPDNQYVPGPRRLFVPAAVGRELERLVAAEEARPAR